MNCMEKNIRKDKMRIKELQDRQNPGSFGTNSKMLTCRLGVPSCTWNFTFPVTQSVWPGFWLVLILMTFCPVLTIVFKDWKSHRVSIFLLWDLRKFTVSTKPLLLLFLFQQMQFSLNSVPFLMVWTCDNSATWCNLWQTGFQISLNIISRAEEHVEWQQDDTEETFNNTAGDTFSNFCGG